MVTNLQSYRCDIADYSKYSTHCFYYDDDGYKMSKRLSFECMMMNGGSLCTMAQFRLWEV